MKWFDALCAAFLVAVVAPLFSLKTRALYWRLLGEVEYWARGLHETLRPYWGLIFFGLWVALVAVQILFGIVPGDDPMGGR